MRAVKLMLWPVRKLWVGCAFEDGWDVAGWLCLTLGIALMSLGTVASPDVPLLWADYPGGGPPPKCLGRDSCNVGCSIGIRVCNPGCAFNYSDCYDCVCIFTEYDWSGNPIACGCR